MTFKFQNICQLFNKSGESLNTFKIGLRSPSSIILDGFVFKHQIYILDFIQCGPFDLESCEFECRRMMGKNYLDEHVLNANFKSDSWTFTYLEPTNDCSKETMEEFMSKETPYELDGLMFYCKDVSVSLILS